MPDTKGNIPKPLVLYNETPPPPNPFFTYQCQYCVHFIRREQQLDTATLGECKAVEGDVKSTAWCALWLPKNPACFIERIISNVPGIPPGRGQRLGPQDGSQPGPGHML